MISSKGLMTPGEAAKYLDVHPKTVTRWANQGKLSPVFTLGGHRRYWRHDIETMVELTPTPEDATIASLIEETKKLKKDLEKCQQRADNMYDQMIKWKTIAEGGF